MTPVDVALLSLLGAIWWYIGVLGFVFWWDFEWHPMYLRYGKDYAPPRFGRYLIGLVLGPLTWGVGYLIHGQNGERWQ